jgi:methanogenic corrinoid protein MtbC1
VHPERTRGGQRLYSDADVERLRSLSKAVRLGRRISDVVELSDDELARVVREDESHSQSPARGEPSPEDRAGDVSSSPDPWIAEALRLVSSLDEARLEHMLERASIRLGAISFLERIAAPFMARIGDAWHAGAISVAHEHMASAVVRRVVERILGAAARDVGAPIFVVATPQGHAHEIGAILAAATAASDGWNVLYLGADLPAADIAEAATQAGARAVGLSAVYTADPDALVEELRKVHSLLRAETSLCLGGSAAGNVRAHLEPIGVTVLGSLTALQMFLRATREMRTERDPSE